MVRSVRPPPPDDDCPRGSPVRIEANRRDYPWICPVCERRHEVCWCGKDKTQITGILAAECYLRKRKSALKPKMECALFFAALAIIALLV